MVSPIMAKHLREAKRELEVERARVTQDIDREIAEIDSLLGGGDGTVKIPSLAAAALSGGAAVQVGLSVVASGEVNDPAPPMRDAIMEMLSSADRAFTTNDVAVALEQRYGWKKPSTRSLISKMGRDGEIHVVRRGVYESNERAATRELSAISMSADPTDTSTSADEAEVEVGVTTTNQDGGEGAASGHGPDHDASGRNDDR